MLKHSLAVLSLVFPLAMASSAEPGQPMESPVGTWLLEKGGEVVTMKIGPRTITWEVTSKADGDKRTRRFSAPRYEMESDGTVFGYVSHREYHLPSATLVDECLAPFVFQITREGHTLEICKFNMTGLDEPGCANMSGMFAAQLSGSMLERLAKLEAELALAIRSERELTASEIRRIREAVSGGLGITTSRETLHDMLVIPAASKIYATKPIKLLELLATTVEQGRPDEAWTAAGIGLELAHGPGAGVWCAYFFESDTFDSIDEHWKTTPRLRLVRVLGRAIEERKQELLAEKK